MNKRTRTLVIVGVAAVLVYLVYRYIQHRGGTDSGSGPLGTNLNSVAPELIGGSSGPSQGPAVDVPVNITLTTTDTSQQNSRANLPANNQTATAAIGGMNTPVGAHPSQSGIVRTPMRHTAGPKSPMTAQHRAAGHPAVTSQSQANMHASAHGATKPSVPSPSAHESRHSGTGTRSKGKAKK